MTAQAKDKRRFWQNLLGPAMVNFLLSELARFTGDRWEQEDDITLVTLDRSETA